MTGNYTVTVTNTNGCQNTAVATVSVISLPIAIAATGGAICVGNTLFLNSSGGSSYSWSGPNGFNSALQNPIITNSTLLAGGIYTVIVTANTCTSSATISAIINPLPNPIINSNSPVCVGQSLNLSGNGGISYNWAGPNGFTSNSQNPSIGITSLNNNGNYTLTVTDANGCTNSTNNAITINPLPSAIAIGGSVCENKSFTFNANGGNTYAWTGPNGFTSNQQNPVLNGLTTSAAGQYTVIVTSSAGCTSTTFANLTVNPNPVPVLTTNAPVCVNTVLNLSASGGITYSWTGPNGFSSSAQNPSINASNLGYAGNYQVSITDANGCSTTTMIAVQINGIPNASILADKTLGCAPLCIGFSLNAGSSVSNYNWNLGNGQTSNQSTAQTCYGASGVYSISATISDAIGCTNSLTYTVQVYPQPVADFNHAPIKPIINQDPYVSFTDASHGTSIIAWQWYFMNSAQYTSTQQNPTFMYSEPGNYAVALIVKSDKGCLDTIVKPLVVGEDYGIYVPNAFTPNGDGVNDVFQPKGFGITIYSLKIFNRWGELVFETNNFEDGWDGKFKGRGDDILQDGSYTWMINTISVFGKSHELTGHVTLIK